MNVQYLHRIFIEIAFYEKTLGGILLLKRQKFKYPVLHRQ